MAGPVPARLSAAAGRRFGLTVGIAFLVFAGIAGWRQHPMLLRALGGIGGALVLAGLVVPTSLGPVERAWMGLAHLLSRVTTPIFLGIVYFGVMVPIGLLMRLVGRRPLVHPLEDASYWRAPPSGGRSDITHQF